MKNILKKYNQNNINNLNESAIGIGILSYPILSFVIIYCASLLIGSKIDDITFNKLLNKYPQLKKLLQNMIDKTSDIFIKNIIIN